MPETTRPSLFDVRSFHFEMEEIQANLHPLDDRRPETLHSQQKLLAKWNSSRDDLHGRVSMDPELMQRRQLERISLLVDTMFASNPFYHRLYSAVGYQSGDLATWDDYNALPTITKDDIIDNLDEFVGHLSLTAEDVYSSRTSGSSGRVMTILQDQATVDRHTLYYLRHYERLLGRQRNLNEWLYEIYLAPNRFTSMEGNYPVFTLSQDCSPTAALEHIRQLRPTILSAFPSYLLRMLELPADVSNLGIEVICTNSEGSSKGERDQIAKSFDAPVFDEYSSEELYLIATECRHDRYHFVEDNVRADVLQPDVNGLGEIVATGLMNSYMPFIRYRQGDVIQIGNSEQSCPCGSRFRALTQFHGRADQFMNTRSGGIVAPDRVMGLYDRTLITPGAKVIEFKLVQESLDRVDLFVTLTADATEPGSEMMNAFTGGLRELFGDNPPIINVRVVDEMPAALSFKRRLITNRISTNSSTN